MIKITCCRIGKKQYNRRCKGSFIKEFKNLGQLAAFVCRSEQSLFFPFITTELTRQQLYQLQQKMYSMRIKSGPII